MVTWNTKTYERLNVRFAQLRPYFEEQDFHVFNCNPKSKLTAFDFVSFEESLRRVKREFGNIDLAKERTLGLYDTTLKQKQRGTGKNMVAVKRKAARQRKAATGTAGKKKTATKASTKKKGLPAKK